MERAALPCYSKRELILAFPLLLFAITSMSDSAVPENSPGLPSPQQPQFSLAEVFWWLTGACIALAAIYWSGICGSVVVMAVFAAVVPRRFGWTSGYSALAIAVALLTAFILFLPVLSTINTRGPSRRAMCSNNIMQIVLALTQYEVTHGSYPPAYFADKQGRPTHSWRAMILKELGRPDLAAAYRWDEPWDGPNNRQLHSAGIKVLRCPSDATNPANGTSYVAVVGPGTAFPGAISVSASQITDDPAETLLLVEIRNGGIGWFEPRDLHVAQMARAINPKQGQGLSSAHVRGVNVGFADGSAQYLPDDLPAKHLKGMLTIDGGEKVELP